jgi:hypothetical protein
MPRYRKNRLIRLKHTGLWESADSSPEEFLITASFQGLHNIEREWDLKSTLNESSILVEKQCIGNNSVQKTS